MWPLKVATIEAITYCENFQANEEEGVSVHT